MELKEGDTISQEGLKSTGWKNTNITSHGYEIWSNGKYRILYDSKREIVYLLYF